MWIPYNKRQQDAPDRDQQHSQSSLVALAPSPADERQNAQQNEEQRDQHLQIDTEANAGGGALTFIALWPGNPKANAAWLGSRAGLYDSRA